VSQETRLEEECRQLHVLWTLALQGVSGYLQIPADLPHDEGFPIFTWLYMEVCYWALFTPLVILQYLYSLQIKRDSKKDSVRTSQESHNATTTK
jgi:hypothetical protein